MNFKELKKNSKISLKKNYVNTVLICITGLILLSLYSITGYTISSGIESLSNLFEYGVFLPNTYYQVLQEYEENQTLDTEDIIEIEKLENQKTLAEKYRVTDGFFKPLLDFLDNEWQILYDNIANMARNILPGNIVVTTGIVSIVMSFVYQFFLANPLKVGYSRFFLENMNYHKTKYSRIFYGFYKNNYINSVKTLGLATIYKDLWNLTIIGGLIKKYSYRLVPYVVAENPNLKANEAITLSRQLMNGYKFKAFLLDFSFAGWEILNILTLGLLGIFFLNPYTEGANAEFYKTILLKKKETEKNEIRNINKLNDLKLYSAYKDKTELDYYPSAEPQPLNHVLQHYSPLSLGLMFFIFSIIGWILEVSLFLMKTHTFINRGVLWGPWLPIYGTGCTLILLIFVNGKLKKHLNNPLLVFLLIMLLCGILEYVTHFIIEITTGLVYWDYAGHFLNINGRICLEGLMEFGLGGLLCVYYLAPKLNTFFNKYNKKLLTIAFIVLCVLLVIDRIYSSFYPNVGYGITELIYPNISGDLNIQL